MKKWLSILVIYGVTVGPLWSSPATANLDQLRRQAQAFYRDGRYPEAVALYQRMTQLNPKDLAVTKEVMWGYWNMQRFELATQAAHRVLELKSDDSEAKNILSWAPRAANRDKMFDLRDKAVKNYQAGRYAQAAEFYRQLVEMDPQNVATLKDWLWALWSSEQYDQVPAVANRILKLQPNDTATKDLMAKLPAASLRKKLAATTAAAHEASSKADYEKALALYQDVLRIKPHDAGAMRTLSWTYYKLQRYVEAKEIALKLTEEQPADPTAWMVLGRMQEACDELEAAIKSYEMSLKLDPKQIEVQGQLGRLYVRLRDLDRGIEFLERVRQSGKAAPSIYPLLGKALFYKEAYAQSADVWAEAYAHDPSRLDYRFQEAQARYYAGQSAGLKTMEELSSDYKDAAAEHFLINEARARGDLASAQRMLEKSLGELKTEDVDRAMVLVGLYITMGQLDQCLKLLDRITVVYPRYAKPYVIQGAIYRERKLYAKAEKLYRKALAINPRYDVARLGIAECEFGMGHWDNALNELRLLRKFDPTNPYLLLREARYLYETGEPDQSRQLLVDWVDKTSKEPVLNILLYHGLTPFKQDPRLAVLGNYRLDVFQDHIRALRHAGYTPVTAQEVSDWLNDKHSLPEKPILVTFDDGRLDSLRYADPVLERYNFKATMFSTLANAGGARPIAYASWPQLISYQQTGRWEIQSHGDQAHTPMAVDEVHKGLFIVNRKWMPERNGYETPEEWRARVQKDMDDSRKEIAARTGLDPVAYAYPDGEYGQHQTNYPEAANENLEIVRQTYKVAFIEDDYGMNAHTRDPARLARIEPDQNWTGDQLVTYLQDKNAEIFIYQELLHQAMWRGRTREAFQWLTYLQNSGVSPQVLWEEEARIRYAAGDLQTGYELASRIITYSPEHFERMIEQNLSREGPAWNPGGLYSKDNRERESYAFEQRFQLPRWGNSNWYLAQRWARYLEEGYSSVTDNVGGFGVNYKPSLFHTLSLDMRGHALSGPAKNALTGSAGIESKWTDLFSTRFEGARDIHYTARAISADIKQTVGGGLLRWEDQKHWGAQLRGRYFDLSDDNTRQLYQGELSKTLDSKDRFRLLYRLTYDDMRDVSPFYYSPQKLVLNEIGPEFSLKFGEHVYATAAYRAGIGKEEGVDQEFVQDLQAQLKIMLSTRAWIMPTYWLQQTPTYRQQTFGVFLRYRFGVLQNMGVPLPEEREDLM